MSLYHGYDFVVAKEGGENTGNIDVTLESLIKAKEKGSHFAVVVSAMRKEGEFNTTKMLESIGVKISEGDSIQALKELSELKGFHKDLLEKNFSGDRNIKNDMFAYIEEQFQKLFNMIENYNISEHIPSLENDFSLKDGDDFFSLKGFGEVFCAKFYNKLLWFSGYSVSLEDISSQRNNISSQGESFENTLGFFRKSVAGNILDPFSQSMGLTLIPGYIGGIEGGIDANIGSGYSDATAAMLAISVQETLGREKKVLLEILKSVDGIMSADPRLLEKPDDAQLIEKLSFLIAKEIVGVRGAQAKLLNSDAMRPQVIRSGVSVRLRNPANPSLSGTLIDRDGDVESNGVEAVLKRDNVAFISLSSIDMPQGYLARVFEIVKKYKSVDVTATSETEFSFTVDMKQEGDQDILEKMREEIVGQIFGGEEDEFCFTKVLYDQSLIFCIGQNMRDKVGLLYAAAGALQEAGISIEIVSQAQQQRAMTFGVASKDAENAVNVLHRRLVQEKIKK